MGQHHSRRRKGGLRKGGLLYAGLSADLSDKGHCSRDWDEPRVCSLTVSGGGVF